MVRSEEVSSSWGPAKRSFVFWLCFLIWAILVASPLHAQSDSTQIVADDTTAYPERRAARESWEKIVSFPGRIVMLPFKLIFKGTNEAVDYLLLPQRVGAVYDFLHSDDGLRAAEPTYSSRGGGGVKIYQKNLISEDSELEFKAGVGLRYRQSYGLEFERVCLPGTSIYSDFLLEYRLEPDESFFGIGPNSNKDDRVSFLWEHTCARAAIGSDLGDKTVVRAALEFERSDIRGGEDPNYGSITEHYTPAELPGLESKVKLLGVGAKLSYDSRNSRGQPTSGKEITLGVEVFDQISGDDYGFLRIKADIKQHLHLFYARTLMLRLASEMTEPLEGRSVPFYHLSELGRGETIRGFSRGRFRDSDAILGSAEYYYPIWQGFASALDAFLFVDGGQVANNIVGDFDPDDLRIGFGGGIRLSGELGEAIRFMMGKSKEGFRFYLDLNM
jgi:outer membrane protein assembly factor BamA